MRKAYVERERDRPRHAPVASPGMLAHNTQKLLSDRLGPKINAKVAWMYVTAARVQGRVQDRVQGPSQAASCPTDP